MGLDWTAPGTALGAPGRPALPNPSASGMQSGGLWAGAGIDPSAQQPQFWTSEQFIKGWDFDQSIGIQSLLADHGYLTGDYHKGMWYEKTVEALDDAMTASREERMPFLTFLLTGASREAASQYMSSGGGSAGPDMSPKTYTATSTSTVNTTNNQVNLSSRAGARQILVGALATELGREPTKREVSIFLRNLNRRERNNPTVSKTTGETTTTSSRTVDPSKSGSSTTSSQNTTGETTTTTRQSNVDPQRMAEKFAKKENPEEWRMFQNAQYFDVLAQMLGM